MDSRSTGGLMKMKQLSLASDLPVSTIKFYMAKGLLMVPEKEKPNVVYYDEAFLKRLLIIKKMRAEGMSIKSMKSILNKYPFEKVSDGTISAGRRGRRKPTSWERRSALPR